MTKRVLIVFAVLVVTTWNGWGQLGFGYSTNRTITVSGSAQVKVAPDEVELLLGIETVSPDLAKAKQENDQKIEAVLKSLKAQKLESRAVQTDAVMIEPHYWTRSSSSEPVPPKLTHYTVRRDVIVALKDVSKFEAVLSAALESGANIVRNITFKSSELRKHRDEARSMAIRAAKEKAVALAGELGMKVGKPFTITESAGNLFLAYGANRGNTFMNAQNVASQEGPAAEVVQGTFAPGQISIDASVSVVFELQ